MTRSHVNPIKIDILPGRAMMVVALLLAGDIVSIGIAFWLATAIRAALLPVLGGVIHWEMFFPMLQLSLLSILAVYALTGLYPGFGQTAVEELQKILGALTLGYGILGLAVYLQKAGEEFSRSIFLIGWALSCLINVIVRFTIRNRASLWKWWGMPVIVVGPLRESGDVIQRLLRSRRLGLRPVLVMDETADPGAGCLHNIPIIQSREQLQTIRQSQAIRYAVFVESPDDSRQAVRGKLGWLSKLFPTVLVVLADSPLGSLWVRTMDLEGRLTLKAQYHLLNEQALFFKRGFDLVVGMLLALVSAPAFALLALLIKIDSPGPVFFAQERLGRGGRSFRCLKFRTMVMDAEQRLNDLLAGDPCAEQEYQTFHKLVQDPRITRVGRLLRKFSLDELPQLWHVLRGEMSLVGPRAYLPEELAEMGTYTGIILQIRPGLTGWWQVMGRHTTTFQHRLQLDEYYLSNWSPWLDIYVMIKTAWVLISGHGV